MGHIRSARTPHIYDGASTHSLSLEEKACLSRSWFDRLRCNDEHDEDEAFPIISWLRCAHQIKSQIFHAGGFTHSHIFMQILQICCTQISPSLKHFAKPERLNLSTHLFTPKLELLSFSAAAAAAFTWSANSSQIGQWWEINMLLFWMRASTKGGHDRYACTF